MVKVTIQDLREVQSSYLGKSPGNPWVSGAWLVPVPAIYPYLHNGSGLKCGYKDTGPGQHKGTNLQVQVNMRVARVYPWNIDSKCNDLPWTIYLTVILSHPSSKPLSFSASCSSLTSFTSVSLTRLSLLQMPRQRRARVNCTESREWTWDRSRWPWLNRRSTSMDVAVEVLLIKRAIKKTVLLTRYS